MRYFKKQSALFSVHNFSDEKEAKKFLNRVRRFSKAYGHKPKRMTIPKKDRVVIQYKSRFKVTAKDYALKRILMAIYRDRKF